MEMTSTQISFPGYTSIQLLAGSFQKIPPNYSHVQDYHMPVAKLFSCDDGYVLEKIL